MVSRSTTKRADVFLISRLKGHEESLLTHLSLSLSLRLTRENLNVEMFLRIISKYLPKFITRICKYTNGGNKFNVYLSIRTAHSTHLIVTNRYASSKNINVALSYYL